MPPPARPRRERLTEVVRLPTLTRRLEQLTGPVRVPLAGIGAAAALAGFAEAGVLVAIARVATTLRDADGTDVSSSAVLGLSLDNTQLLIAGAALVFVTFSLQMVAGWGAAATLMRAIDHTRETLLEAHSEADWPTKESLSTSEFVQLIIPNASRVGDVVQSLATFASAGAMFVALVVSALVIDPLGALAIMVGVAILLAITFPLIRRARGRNARLVGMNKDYAKAVHEYAAIGREVQVFGVQEASTRGIRAVSAVQARELRDARRITVSSTALFKSAALLLVLALLAVVVVGGTGEVASYAAISLILLRSVSYGQSLQSNLHALAEASPWIDDLVARIDELRAAGPAGPTRSTPPADGRYPTPAPGPVTIELRDVRFAYGDAEPVFDGFDLTIAAGGYIGVVGPSGVGKSTLAELILGLRRPSHGLVLADDVDLSTIPAEQWARRTAFVPQEPVLIHGSILDNVRFFRPWISDDDAEAALAAANVLGDLSFLPDGLATESGALGSRLSGGQRQRIAIARALADHPGLIVLDEPTSALDSVSESRITETLDALRGSTTLVVIAHRWSTLERCDRAIALARTGIAADGTPEAVRIRSGELDGLAELDEP